jgi:hypothetical protein
MSSINESAGRQFHSDPELQRYITNLKTFISLFPPGKMNEELWQLACFVYNKQEETGWQYIERFNVYGMYKLLSDLCVTMQKIVEYFERGCEPQMTQI